MNRNEKEKRLKTIKKLEKIKDELPRGPYESGRGSYYQSGLTWIPVEEPKFIGWETTLVLNDSANRRSDAPRIKAVMDLLGWNKPEFIRDQKTIKLIRQAGKRFSTYKSLWLEDIRKKGYVTLQDNPPGTKHTKKVLSDEKYKLLDESLKKYFTMTTRVYPASAFRDSYIEYTHHLNSYFPEHQVLIKIDKAYSTHRGIPKSNLISERQKIENQFIARCYYEKLYSDSKVEKWYHKRATHSKRKAWNSVLNVSKQYYDNEWWQDDYNPDEVADTIDTLAGKKVKHESYW